MDNGGGLFSREFKSRAAKAIWDFKGIYATSRHIPGVRFAGIPHPGLIGTAPSQELLDLWNTREQGLIDAHKQPDGSDCVPAVALPPSAKGWSIQTRISKSLSTDALPAVCPGRCLRRSGSKGRRQKEDLHRGS